MEGFLWKTGASQAGSQPCLCDRPPTKTLDTEAQVSIPGWQYTTHVVTHHYWQSNTILDSVGRGQLEVHIQNSSAPAFMILALPDFNLYHSLY